MINEDKSRYNNFVVIGHVSILIAAVQNFIEDADQDFFFSRKFEMFNFEVHILFTKKDRNNIYHSFYN